MFTNTTGQCVIDSILCVGAALANPPTGEPPDIQLTMVYAQKSTGITFGTCPVQRHLLSKKTIELAKAFLTSAEEDYGQLVFGEGTVSEPGSTEASRGDGEQRRGLGWKG